MNVSIPDLGLDTIVTEIWRSEEEPPEPVTIGDRVAEAIVARLVRDADRWHSMTERVREIRDDVIRERLEPLIAAALTAPLRPTNGLGQPNGPETTLEEMILATVKRIVTEPVERHGFGPDRQTVLQKMVSETIATVLKPKVTELAVQIKDEMTRQLGTKVGVALAAQLSR